MEAVEIPSKARGLCKCAGCKQRHMCSWLVDGRKYCEECASKLSDKVKLPEIKAQVDQATPVKSQVFALQPKQTIHLSIGELETGWVICINGHNHVYTTKTKMIKALDGMINKKAPELDGHKIKFAKEKR